MVAETTTDDLQELKDAIYDKTLGRNVPETNVEIAPAEETVPAAVHVEAWLTSFDDLEKLVNRLRLALS
jgi:hypothetical protein